MRRDKTRILLTDHIPLPRRYKRGHGDARKLRPRECRAVQHHAGLLPLGDRINEPVGKPVGRFQSRRLEFAPLTASFESSPGQPEATSRPTIPPSLKP